MKVGTICKLKVDCLGNKAGTLGVVFNDYGDGVQVIFENGSFDGFSRTKADAVGNLSEAELYLEEVGFEESLAGYQFKNVMEVSEDYRKGLFNIAWSEKWKKPVETAEPEEYEKCEVYADACKPAAWLRFKRDFGGGTVGCYMLSAAMDFADFSHFEYARLGESNQPRWIVANRTLYPKFVVFRKKTESEESK